MKTLKIPNLLQMFLGLLFILTVFSFIFPLPVAAFDWHTANQGTVAWDAVTSILKDGQPEALPDTDTLEYSVYVSDSGLPIRDSTATWRGAETSTVITLTQEGSFYIGVKAHRIRDGTELSQSIVSWSDDPQVTNNSPFGFVFWMSPSIVHGLRPSA